MFKRKRLQEGVYWNHIDGSKFKTGRISVSFVLPLCEQDVCANAILQYLLRNGFKGCADVASFNRMLARLYEAVVDTEVKTVADLQVLSIGITYLKDKFALQGEHIEQKSVELLFDLIMNPIFGKNSQFEEWLVAQQKQVLAEEIEGEQNDKRSYARKACSKLMFEGTNCAIAPVGELEGVKLLSLSDVTGAYFRALKEARIEVICVGVETQDVHEEKFIKALNNYKTDAKREWGPSVHTFRSNRKDITKEMEVVQAKLVLGLVGKVEQDEMKIAANKLMTVIYGQSATSKLFVNIREKQSLCYYCSAQHNTFTGSMLVDSGVDEQNIEAATQGIIFEFEKMQKGEFTTEEFESAKFSLKNQLRSILDSNFALETWYQTKLFGGSETSPEEFCELIDRLKPENVVCEAKNYSVTTSYVLKGGKKVEKSS